MDRSYFKITGNGEILSAQLLDSCGDGLAKMVYLLRKGGTLTVRGNAYGFEAIWTPPENKLPPLPSVTDDEKFIIEGKDGGG